MPDKFSKVVSEGDEVVISSTDSSVSPPIVERKVISIERVFDRGIQVGSTAELGKRMGIHVDPHRLIPETHDEGEEEGEKSDEYLRKDLMDGLGSILLSLVGIKKELQKQSNDEQKRVEQSRVLSEQEKKRKRENEIEAQNKDNKNKMAALAEAPQSVVNIFSKIGDFLKGILVGSAALGLYNWLANPENQKGIKNALNFIEKHGKLFLAAALGLAALDIGLKIWAAIKAIKAVVAVVTGAAFTQFLAIVLAIAGIGVGLGWISKWLDRSVSGGDELKAARKNINEQYKERVAELNKKAGPDDLQLHAEGGWLVYPKSHPLAGQTVYSKNWYGNRGWLGPADAIEDPTGKSTGVSRMVIPGELRADGEPWGTVQQSTLIHKRQVALDKIGSGKNILGGKGSGLHQEMWDKINAKKKEVQSQYKEKRREIDANRKSGETNDEEYRKKVSEVRKWRINELKKVEEEVKEEYKGKLRGVITTAYKGKDLTIDEIKESYGGYSRPSGLGDSKVQSSIDERGNKFIDPANRPGKIDDNFGKSREKTRQMIEDAKSKSKSKKKTSFIPLSTGGGKQMASSASGARQTKVQVFSAENKRMTSNKMAVKGELGVSVT